MNLVHRIEQYLNNATRCEHEAERVRDPLAQQTFRDAAAHWRDLANQVRPLLLDRDR